MAIPATLKNDDTGLLCYQQALTEKNKRRILILQKMVLEKDKIGKVCYLFARYVESANKELLINNIIKISDDGQFCFETMRDVEIPKLLFLRLEKSLIEKDLDGQFLFEASKIKHKWINKNKYLRKILKLNSADRDRWLYEFVKFHYQDFNKEKLFEIKEEIKNIEFKQLFEDKIPIN